MLVLFLLAPILLLTGCNPFWMMAPSSEKIQTSNWAPQKKPTKKPKLYCYKTLGEVMCYKKPIKGAEERFVGPIQSKTQEKENPIEALFSEEIR